MSSSLQTTIRDLHRRRGRERRGLALAEGVRLVEEALAAAVPIRGAAVGPALEATPRGRALKAALVSAGVRLEEIGASELDRLADTEHPQGIVAVVEPRRWSLDHMEPGNGAVLVLDAVQDPGNVGTMLRTAYALGAAGAVALPGTAELGNPKVMRGSMGALFRLPAVPASHDEFLTWAKARGVALWLAAADGEPLSAAIDRRREKPHPVAIVVGNEGAGVSERLEAAAAVRVGIPLAPEAESLNVGVAAGILLYEVLRGR
ncbi:MAG TPA: RNA methyltransferase [Gemmatimonadales bacterium]|nr:RNA methyltransferase [Gemmatimonadales bacterium]